MATILPMSAVLDQIVPTSAKFTVVTVDIDGAQTGIKVNHGRLRMYKAQPTCVCCGRTADVAVVDKTPHSNSLDEYLINICITTKDGHVPLTTDHILLACVGGQNTASNYQTMCQECNAKKADVMSDAEIALVRNDVRRYAKSWVDSSYLNYLLELNAEYNQATRAFASGNGTVTKKQLVSQFQAMKAARLKLQYGKKPPIVQQPVVDEPKQITWASWWDARPSLMAPVYGWLGRHHSLLLAI